MRGIQLTITTCLKQRIVIAAHETIMRIENRNIECRILSRTEQVGNRHWFIYKEKNKFLLKAVSVISSDPPCQHDNARFTMAHMKALSAVKYGLDINNYNFENCVFSIVVYESAFLLQENRNNQN